MPYGLTLTGFVPKTYEVIVDEINAVLETEFGTNFPNGPLISKLVGIIAERFALLWELAEEVNASQDPDAAVGAKQDAICAITGTIREAAESSTVTATLTGTPSTVVPVGSIASVEDTDDQFSTDAEATIVAVSAWAPTTAYVVGDVVTNGGRVYQCSQAGTSAGSGGPVGTDLDSIGEVDNTAEWDYLGDGTGAVDVAMSSVDTGPIAALSRTLNQIDTAVAGWSSVVNDLDADLGRDVESDGALRVRREDELVANGTSPKDAIRAALLAVDDVTAVTVFQNVSDVTDGDGLPPHSIEALVQGGTDQDIWDTLLASVAAGIQTYGTEVGTAEDDQGNDITEKFTRPTEINIYAAITLTYDADLYPTTGDDLVKAAVASLDAEKTGLDVVSSRVKGVILFGDNAVPGVLDVSVANIGTSASPTTETTVAIALRELARYDTSRVTVSSSAGTP